MSSGVSSALWFATASLLSLGVLALPSVGMYLLPAGAIVALLTFIKTKGKGISGALLGLGIFFLWIAYLQRYGPGTVCLESQSPRGGGRACGEYQNPLPFLFLGLGSTAGYIITQVIKRRNASHTQNPLRPEHRDQKLS